MSIHELRAKRATAFDQFKAVAEKKDFTVADQPEYDRLKGVVLGADAEIKRAQELVELEVKTALPVAGQDERHNTWAQVKDDPYTEKAHAEAKGLGTNKGLMIGAMARMIGKSGGNILMSGEMAKQTFGERHVVTSNIMKALAAGVGASGGFIVPPDYVNEIIELLRPRAVVRASNPRSMPMPRGTMTLPAQTNASTATYGGETTQINAAQPTLGQIIATYKKMTALVPVTNDLMRYADPAADAFVRDDLVKVTALREDLAFLMGDGTQDSPIGFLSFANAWVGALKGTLGAWSSTGNSTGAVGGGFITSTGGVNVSLTTVANELAGMVNKLDTQNVPDIRRKWFFHPRIFNFLNNLLNSLGMYVYRDELAKGTLLGYPFAKSTQIPININDATSANSNCTFIFLVEMDDALILDSMNLELSVSREGTFYDTNGVLQSAFQKDLTIIRGIMEHDFQMRHQASIAVNQLVTWSPAAV
jgi:HK97 family phage major capsid protein